MREAAIIEMILAHTPHEPAPAGPGDDAAVLGAAPMRVVTTDVLVEGTHFLREHPPEALGWKSLAVNLSDVAAMGAAPEGFTLALVLPEAGGDIDDAWVEAFAEGLGACARAGGVVIAGGDTVRGPSMMITITAWGMLDGPPLLRSGGSPGDVLLVAGPIGRSGAGLTRWLADRTSDLADPLLRAHLRPEPPLWAAPLARRMGAHAAMDLSDGLATDLPRLARASSVDLRVDLDHLPADELLAGLDARTRAASGEDYALVVLAPESRVSDFVASGFVAIGAALAVADTEARVVWHEHGVEVAAVRPAFAHFRHD